MAVTRAAGVTSKARFSAAKPSGESREPPTVWTSSGERSSTGMSAPVLRGQVDGRRGGGHVERHAVVGGQHGQRVRADLVGHVAVGRHPVGADHDQVDVARGHERAGHHVGHQGGGDAEPVELPGGEAGPLEHGPGLVDPHPRALAGLGGGPDDPEGRAVPDAGQRPGVAVGQDLGAVGHEQRRRGARAPGCRPRPVPPAAPPPPAPPAPPSRSSSAAASAAASTRRAPQARLTAVGRVAIRRSAASAAARRTSLRLVRRPQSRPGRRRSRRTPRGPGRPARPARRWPRRPRRPSGSR